MKAKCYRLDYNELGLSTLCVKKDKEIERLKEEYIMLQNASDKEEEEKDEEIERLNNIINEFNEFIEEVYNHINLGDESDEFMLVFDKWQELKGVDKE